MSLRPGEPRPLVVPPELAAVTRFEPSGVLWEPSRDRYLVVSDDTGLEGQRGRHAPVLFAVDAQGQVDPTLVPIAGLTKLSDPESIARGPDGALYVLASQSRSRDGERSRSRQIFARAVPDDAGDYVATGTVHLFELLQALPAPERVALGLAGTPDDLDELDIEGMCGAPQGLLIGLKSPLDGEGRALVWRLADPERLFVARSLANAGLSLFARAPLTTRAGGELVAGGVAEALMLPDGRLLLASTVPDPRPGRQVGVIWVTDGPPSGPLLALRQVRAFEGLKPEGLSLSPNPGAIAVFFDRDEQSPLWTEMRLPTE